MEIIQPEDYAFYTELANSKGLIQEEDTSVIFYDFSILDNRLSIVRDLFPQNALHSVAIKSNPLLKVLSHIQNEGFGLECASFGELLLAEKSGIDSNKIVFDSPAKTQLEIDEIAIHHSAIYVNVDSLQELERYKNQQHLKLGLRVNPLVNSDTVSSMNVGGTNSKFGELISNRAAIINAFKSNSNLIGLHVHSGSQFHNLSPTISGIRKIIDLANEINSHTNNQITTIDIGGGFPVNYKGDPFTIDLFVVELKKNCLELFDGTFQLITEFGRFYHANAGWLLTNVEYVKEDTGNVIVHSGADMFLREAYNPNDWYHKIFVLNSEFRILDSGIKKQNIGGPLCFGGDYIIKDRDLPQMKQGDKIIIADCGANTFSLWSKHCSRQFPKVIGYSSKDKGQSMKILKDRESYEKLISFWE